MLTKLTMHEAERTITNGVLGSGPGYVYRVGGMPPGEEAQIAEFNHSWCILRWNESWHGNWTGKYTTAEAALAALQDEVKSAVA